MEEGFSVEASEEVAALHNAQEETCRRHLRSFQQLAEIGFPTSWMALTPLLNLATKKEINCSYFIIKTFYMYH